ncbi:putative patatin-like phospholipase [Candidatus Vecturithrix granuli]|uniref:Putative patatin-like phospholipase n=1 Tax=Vecturithrix granuli TaxID=1499967 RepID=A0A081C0A7_VECG1|nr:putative patatin-like phospholipase [Candidatus Vecturithrix granuli]
MSKLGLVFSGGGGKGAYQIGVWRALKEFGLAEKVRAVSGTSVGALNALLFVQQNYELAEHLWFHIQQEDILNIDPELIATILREAPISIPPAMLEKVLNFFCSRGIWSRDGLIRMLKKAIDAEAIAASSVTIFAACTNVTDIPSVIRPVSALTHYLFEQSIPEGDRTYFRLNDYDVAHIRQILLASSALPILFHAEQIDGRVYYDGGLVDNTPVMPVYKEGCDLILVVQLDPLALVEREYFPDAEILTIAPQETQGSFWGGTLDFSREGAERRVQQGYADALRILQPVAAMRDLQQQISTRLTQVHSDEQTFQHKLQELLQQREEIKKTLKSL